jgi:hypothetical protein
MGRPDLKKEFPFLRVTAPKPVGSCCGGQRQDLARYQQDLDRAKQALIAMSEEQKLRFKTLLRVNQVVLFIGGTQRHAF